MSIINSIANEHFDTYEMFPLVSGEGYPAWLGMVPKNGWPTPSPQPQPTPTPPPSNPGQNGFVTNHPPANSYICFPFNGNVNGNSNGNNGQPGNGNSNGNSGQVVPGK